jgi:hypothetical protein
VAFFARIARCQMGRRFTDGVGSVVTGNTIGGDTIVGKRRTAPAVGRFVTVFAIVGRCDVIRRFSRRLHAVMAATTIARYPGMIEISIAEIVGIMTIFAAVARLRVVDCLADGFYPVVTRNAGIGDARVIKARYGPFARRVAAFTCGLCCYVISRLARSVDIVVATRAGFRRANKNAAFMA